MRGYIWPIVMSGPGNQIVGLKEAALIARRLDRTLVVPPILAHYRARQRGTDGRLGFDFAELFDLRRLQGFVPCVTPAELPAPPTRMLSLRVRPDPQAERAREFYAERTGHPVDQLPLEVLEQRALHRWADVDRMRDYDDTVIGLYGVFNNLSVSVCRWNGCARCPTNPIFAPAYAELCDHLVAAPRLRWRAEKFCAERFEGRRFLAFHLRVADMCAGKRFDEVYLGHPEGEVWRALLTYADQLGVRPEDIFVAVPPYIDDVVGLKHFHRERGDAVVYPGDRGLSGLECSLIEQAICARSTVFVRSISNIPHTGVVPEHPRSTWNTFVHELRQVRSRAADDRYITDLLGSPDR